MRRLWRWAFPGSKRLRFPNGIPREYTTYTPPVPGALWYVPNDDGHGGSYIAVLDLEGFIKYNGREHG